MLRPRLSTECDQTQEVRIVPLAGPVPAAAAQPAHTPARPAAMRSITIRLEPASVRTGYAVMAYRFRAGKPLWDAETGDLIPDTAWLLDRSECEVLALSIAVGHALTPDWENLAGANFVGVVDRRDGRPVDIIPIHWPAEAA